jgi:hypothetical protein
LKTGIYTWGLEKIRNISQAGRGENLSPIFSIICFLSSAEIWRKAFTSFVTFIFVFEFHLLIFLAALFCDSAI